MNKKTYILFIIIAVVVLLGGFILYSAYMGKKDNHGCLTNKGYLWCESEEKCVQGKENCSFTVDSVIAQAKKIIGLDLNVMKEIIKYNTENEKLALDAKGCYYLDALKAEKITKGFNDLDNFFNQNGFSGDQYNPPFATEKEAFKIYKKNNVVCQIKKADNENDTTSLSVFCANEKDTMCNFSDEACGTKCEQDSDCGVLLDSCKRKTVCRNINFKFYNDCENPSAKIDDISFGINRCKCSDNKCVVKFSDE